MEGISVSVYIIWLTLNFLTVLIQMLITKKKESEEKKREEMMVVGCSRVSLDHNEKPFSWVKFGMIRVWVLWNADELGSFENWGCGIEFLSSKDA